MSENIFEIEKHICSRINQEVSIENHYKQMNGIPETRRLLKRTCVLFNSCRGSNCRFVGGDEDYIS